MFLMETFLQGMEFASLFQALYGHNLAAIRLDSKHGAGFGSLSIDDDSTGATGCCITTNMCAGQLQVITYPMD